MYEKRISNFKKRMKCDFVFLLSKEYNENLFYFTGFTGYGILVIFKKKQPLFFTTKLDVCKLKNKKLKTIIIDKKTDDILKKYIQKRKVAGFDYQNISLSSFTRIKKAIILVRTQRNCSSVLGNRNGVFIV